MPILFVGRLFGVELTRSSSGAVPRNPLTAPQAAASFAVAMRATGACLEGPSRYNHPTAFFYQPKVNNPHTSNLHPHLYFQQRSSPFFGSPSFLPLLSLHCYTSASLSHCVFYHGGRHRSDCRVAECNIGSQSASQRFALPLLLCPAIFTLPPANQETSNATAEAALKQQATKPQYSIALLNIVSSDTLPVNTRLSAALAFKNFIRTSYVVRARNLSSVLPTWW